MDEQVEPGERHPDTAPVDGTRPELLAAEPSGPGETTSGDRGTW